MGRICVRHVTVATGTVHHWGIRCWVEDLHGGHHDVRDYSIVVKLTVGQKPAILLQNTVSVVVQMLSEYHVVCHSKSTIGTHRDVAHIGMCLVRGKLGEGVVW